MPLIFLFSQDDPSFGGLFPLQPEGDSHAYKRMKDSLDFADESQSRVLTEQPKWTRLPGQVRFLFNRLNTSACLDCCHHIL